MIGRILNRAPQNWPFMSPIWVLVCLVVYFTPDLITRAFVRANHLPMVGDIPRNLMYMHAGLLGLFLVIMGLARATVPHPRGNPRYRNWLKTTPWHPAMPLPLGPITLHFYDLALLAVTGFMLWSLRMPPELAVLLYGIPYTLAVMRHLLSTGPSRTDYLLMFGLMAIAWALPDMRIAALILVAMYPIEHWAIRHSLKTFPWEPQVPRHSVPLGWSFERLSPEPTKFHVPMIDALIMSLLIGIAVYLIFLKSFVEFRAELVPILVFVGCIAAYMRLGIYWDGVSNPLGPFTRFATGRLIIPGFDQILVAPILVVAVLLAVFKLSKYRPIEPIGAGALAAVVAMTLLGMGPRLSQFRLTGAYNVSKRYGAASQKKSFSTYTSA